MQVKEGPSRQQQSPACSIALAHKITAPHDTQLTSGAGWHPCQRGTQPHPGQAHKAPGRASHKLPCTHVQLQQQAKRCITKPQSSRRQHLARALIQYACASKPASCQQLSLVRLPLQR